MQTLFLYRYIYSEPLFLQIVRADILTMALFQDFTNGLMAAHYSEDRKKNTGIFTKLITRIQHERLSCQLALL